MTAPLAELMTAREFGELRMGNCPICGGGQGCPCNPLVLSPLPESVCTEPWSWARVTGATATGVVLALWAAGLAALYVAEWRGAA